MIRIKHKSDCCGCEACVQRCPKRCISLHRDQEGFLYPLVDESICIDCGLCERVCPVINQGEPLKPLVAYAAKNQDESVRLSSSSGGVFTALAEQVIAQGGVVFGARFDESWNVVHDYVETVEGLSAFRGAKYAQSRIGLCFLQAETFLRQGRQVLFSGLPCQIAGLKKFLRKDYDNLITVDLFCHGVPSPLVWKRFLEEEVATPHTQLKSISFRDKASGWKNYSFSYLQEDADGIHLYRMLSAKNFFMRGFLDDLYLRPSCYHCPAKQCKSGSDLTIGDYWGIQQAHPELDDDKGVSAILVNTDKGAAILQAVQQVSLYESTFEKVVKCNPALIKSAQEPTKRSLFFELLNQRKISEVVLQLTHLSVWTKIRRKVFCLLSH